MVDRGLLKYDEKVSKYWPEFAQKGKGDLKLADVMRHEAGLAYIHHTWKGDDFYPENIKKNPIGKVIEEAEQKFPPKTMGTDREYHGMTRGLILNEIFRRVEPQGRTIGEFLRDEVCGPMNADVVIGTNKEDEEKLKKLTAPSMGTVACHSMIPKAVSHRIEVSMWGMIKSMYDMSKMMKNREGEPKKKQLVEGWSEKFEPSKTGDHMDTESMKRGEFPSFNGVASARGLARLGACMVNGGSLDGVKIMSEETVKKFLYQPTAKLDGAMPNNFVSHMTQGGVGVFL